MSNFKFIKYWGYFFLDSQYWLNLQYYFYFIYYKIKIIDLSSLKLMAMPDIFFKFFFKVINFSFFSNLDLKPKYMLAGKNNYLLYFKKSKNYYLINQFINLYNSFLLSNPIFLYFSQKNFFFIVSYPNSLFYVNYNIFSILFFFKFKYFLKVRFFFSEPSLVMNSLNLLGLSTRYF